MKYLKNFNNYIKENSEITDYWLKLGIIIKKVIINLAYDLNIKVIRISEKLIAYGIPPEIANDIAIYMNNNYRGINPYNENRLHIDDYVNEIISYMKQNSKDKFDRRIDRMLSDKVYDLGDQNN